MTLEYNCGQCMIKLGSKEDAERHMKEKHPDAVAFVGLNGVGLEDKDAKIVHDMFYGEDK